MKIISWNLNGLLASLAHGDFAPVSELRPDIVCLQEIRTKQQKEVLAGYNHYWNASDSDGYSGTLALTKTKPAATLYGLGSEMTEESERVLTLEVEGCYIINCYVPNSQRSLKRRDFRRRWDEAFRSFVKTLQDEGKPIIICGDFNVARLEIDVFPENQRQYYARQGYASDELAGLESLIALGFVDAFRYLYPDTEGAYTWWSNRLNKRKQNRGWRLDYFLVAEEIADRIKDVRHLTEVYGSDHCPIELEIAL